VTVLHCLKNDVIPFCMPPCTGGGTFFKVGGTSARQKIMEKFLRFELATVTSQAFKSREIRPPQKIRWGLIKVIHNLAQQLTKLQAIKLSILTLWNTSGPSSKSTETKKS